MIGRRIRWPLLSAHRWFFGATVVFLPLMALTARQVYSSRASTAEVQPSRSLAEGPVGAPPADHARRVQVVEVDYGNTGMEATYPGTVRAADTAALAFRVGGPLVEVNVKPGDAVRRGDVLMRIDPRDYENAVRTATAALDSARAKLSAMKAGAREEDVLALEARIESAIAKRTYLQAMYERNERLVQSNAVSRAAFDASESELAAIVAEIRALDQELQKAKTGARAEDIEAMEADIRGMETNLKTAADRLADASLRAPFDGIIARRMVENHEQVSAGENVVVMHDIARLKIDVALPDKELLHRPMDEPFRVAARFVAMPDRAFEAAMEEISTEADPATRTYLATFTMPSPADLNVFPGMIADVAIESRSQESGKGRMLQIPASALQSNHEGSRFVWVVSDGVVRRRPVVVGALAPSNRYEVLGGVAAGDRIVAAGAAFLHEGAAVEAAGVAREEPLDRITRAVTR